MKSGRTSSGDIDSYVISLKNHIANIPKRWGGALHFHFMYGKKTADNQMIGLLSIIVKMWAGYLNWKLSEIGKTLLM